VKVCLVSSQIAAWGKIGGFGTATRALGRALAAEGVEVSAVVPRRESDGQGRIEDLDGIRVHGTGKWESLLSGRIFREIGANIYHSQEPTIGSYLARRAMPEAVHIVTCRDPRDWRAHLVELRHTTWKRRLLAPASLWYEAGPLVKRAVRRADAVLTPAPSCLHSRIHSLYGADVAPHFFPTPVDLPSRPPRKSDRPTVLFVGRLDPRKRVETFFHLAGSFPEVRFIAVGRSHDAGYDRSLRKRFESLPNVEMPGFVPRFGPGGINRYYEQAWILVNTSAREGLPSSFIEAAAWGTAILSGLDPEEFASRFGEYVRDRDFASGLETLLAGERWRVLGQEAARYVAAHWSEETSVRRHLNLYRSLL
jgi:glycosyltransferase involved in cell wall biosynthesis